MLKVDADLMGAPSMEVAEDESGFGGEVRGDDLVIGYRGFAARWRNDSHFLAIHGMAADVGEDGILLFSGNAIGDGEVDFLHRRAFGKLVGEALMSGVGFRDD